MKLKSLALPLIVAALIGAGMTSAKTPTRGRMIKRPLHIENKTGFVQVHGPNLIKPDGSQLFIIGTNLGNWLNPEGYMFGFGRTNAPRQINDLFCELVGPEFTADFWKQYKDNYITRKDIEYIASTGANTIRLPFHYKLFTDEDYMGLTKDQDGFARMDSVIKWSRDNNLFVILDMHDAPAGQTGDNIDDSYGYPWLFESPKAQAQIIDIWHRIADRYKDEPVILGYELMNEPIATHFDKETTARLNAELEPLYKRITKAIREVDHNHIILAGAPQWNTNFSVFQDTDFDPQLMYTCHRYGGDPTPESLQHYIDFRNKTNRPMYMGEIGHNSDEWQSTMVQIMQDNNIGYTFWPYKKRDNSCMMGVSMPAEWDSIVKFSEGPHATFAEIREHRPDQALVRKAMTQYLDNIRFENCKPQVNYIKSMGLYVPEK